jgi:hypothetical protein
MNRFTTSLAALMVLTPLSVLATPPDSAPPGTPTNTAVPAKVAPASTASTPTSDDQLRANLRQIRMAFEQENERQDATARMNTQALQVATSDSPSIADMRTQLQQQFAQLSSRCLGVQPKVTNGSLVMICGDNSGTAESTNLRNNTTNVLVQTAPVAGAPVSP